MEKLTTAQVQLRLTDSQSHGRKHTSKRGEEPHRAHPHSGTAYLSFLCVFLMDSKYSELIPNAFAHTPLQSLSVLQCLADTDLTHLATVNTLQL